MVDAPLIKPADTSLLSAFAKHFEIIPRTGSVASLTEIASAFATLPYENLSKIIRYSEAADPSAARESPAEIVSGHLQWGTGGTCFSLTATLLHLIRSLGFEAEPLLADRPYGPNTHCALIVMIDGQPHLLDPGYLLVQPVPVATSTETIIQTSFNSVRLQPQREGERLELATLEAGGWKERLAFKTSPVDTGEFLNAWDASFDWEMMHYPVLTRVVGGRQLYQRGLFGQTRSHAGIERREVSQDQLVQQIASQFGIASDIVYKALKVLDLA